MLSKVVSVMTCEHVDINIPRIDALVFAQQSMRLQFALEPHQLSRCAVQLVRLQSGLHNTCR